MLGDMKETAGIDDRVGNRLVGRDDDVVDISDPLVLVIVDVERREPGAWRSNLSRRPAVRPPRHQ